MGTSNRSIDCAHCCHDGRAARCGGNLKTTTTTTTTTLSFFSLSCVLEKKKFYFFPILSAVLYIHQWKRQNIKTIRLPFYFYVNLISLSSPKFDSFTYFKRSFLLFY
jgi:hypothetical protein